MTRKLLVLICVTLLNSVITTSGQENKGYAINGIIEGLPDGTRLFLKRNNISGGSDTVNITTVSNKKFQMKGKILEPELYFLFTENKDKYVYLLLSDTLFSINGNINAWPVVQVDGTKENDEFLKIRKKLEDEVAIQNRLLKEITVAMQNGDSVQTVLINTELTKWGENYHQTVIPSIINSHLNSLYTPLVIMKQTTGSFSKKIEMFDKLTPYAKAGKYGREFYTVMKLQKLAESASAENKAPDFSLPNHKDGSLVTLSKFTAQNKLTFIDFWASWCVPCRAQFPQLMKTFVDFNKDGFTILGVSIDTKPDSWKKAIEEEKLPWTNVADSLGIKSAVARLYNITSIPQSVLVDKDNKIIGKNLHGDELYNTVREYLIKNK